MDHSIDAQAHLDTLSLLRDVAEYLGRLPVHPMTAAMVRRIESHLESDPQRAQQKRLEWIVAVGQDADRIRAGGTFQSILGFSGVGAPSLTATLKYPVLELASPAANQYRDDESQVDFDALCLRLGNQLADGLQLNLRQAMPEAGLGNGQNVSVPSGAVRNAPIGR